MWARGTCGERAGYDSAEPSMPPSVAAAPPQRPFGGGSSFPSVAAALLFWQNPAKDILSLSPLGVVYLSSVLSECESPVATGISSFSGSVF